MWDRHSLERELDELGVREYQHGPTANDPKFGFVLHINFGLLKPVVVAAGGKSAWPGATFSPYTFGRHGFEMHAADGAEIARLFVLPTPFPATAAGRKTLDQTLQNLATFAQVVQRGCARARPQRIAVKDNAGNSVKGQPRPFLLHPHAMVPIARLPFGGGFDPKDCSLWAEPVATVTVPLEQVRALVRRIQATEGKRAGVAFTGPPGARTGRRSDALVFAEARVDKARTQLIAEKRVLSDRTRVDATTFSERLRGFLILLASYLWTDMLSYDFTRPSPANPRDFETLPEAYLPIAVKAPFSEIFQKVLSPIEQRIFRELFGQGAARARLFRLALANATVQDGSNKLLPPGPRGEVHRQQQAEFGTVPTWDDLVEHTLDPTHNRWGHRVLVKPTGAGQWNFVDFFLNQTRPRVALELRRIGFAPVAAKDWAPLMRSIFEMTRQLNP